MENHIYNETLSSPKTHALFTFLTVAFLTLFLWRWSNVGLDGWAITFLCFSAFFLFYMFNYNTLKIRITPETLQLTFGIISWKVAIANIKNCHIDEVSLRRIGGAGLHFTWIKGKYRAFWNFLEYPRVVLSLKKKHGVVHEIAFSTKQPEQVMEIIQNRLN
jgi:hypothetical protein